MCFILSQNNSTPLAMYQRFVNFLSRSEKQQKMIPIGGA